MTTLASKSKVLSTSSIIKGNEINITDEEWTALNSQYSQEEIIQVISDAMDEVPMPMRNITLKEALDDFKALQELDTETILKKGKTFTRYEYKYELLDEYIDIDKTGNLASDYFHQESRYHCDSLNAPSPYRTWTTEKFRKNVLKNLWTMETKRVDMTRLRSCLALRNYIASQFRPSAAKAIYDKFNTRVTWDFSSGWGDRLAGFAAAKNTEWYIGTDPNERLHTGYAEQYYWYVSKYGKKATIGNHPAENGSWYPDDRVDTIFTSPPYFDTERYTQEPNQSWKRYKKLEDWRENFLFKVIESGWEHLDTNGILAINIADTYGHHRRNEMCDPMNDFIATLPNSEYQGALGYRMAKRPNSASDKTGIFVEPIWIWKKLS